MCPRWSVDNEFHIEPLPWLMWPIGIVLLKEWPFIQEILHWFAQTMFCPRLHVICIFQTKLTKTTLQYYNAWVVITNLQWSHIHLCTRTSNNNHPINYTTSLQKLILAKDQVVCKSSIAIPTIQTCCLT